MRHLPPTTRLALLLTLLLAPALYAATEAPADPAGANASTTLSLPELKVSDDHRHLITTDGKPFFYLADTAWELFHRLTREEADQYLTKRAAQGFNVIQAVALAEHDLSTPNAYGELALHNFDPTQPNEEYFRHVDYIIDRAAALGLRVGFLPTWGDKWNKKWGKGPEIFTPENARLYGAWLGRRYREKPIVWILGADRPVETDLQRAIVRALAAGLKEGDGGRHLITFHPSGAHNSSDYWPDEPWLDFHQFQSGHHAKDIHNFDYNAKNLALPALKPTLDGEPCYEDHPVRGLVKAGQAPTVWFDDYDARRAAWWSVLSGACGHVYGDHSVWQFYDGKRQPIFHARTPWPQALDAPGARQMGYLKSFMEKLDWQKLRRDDHFLNNVPDPAQPPGHQIMAAVATDKSFAVVYSPTFPAGIAPKLETLSLTPDTCKATAFDPATGRELGLMGFTGGGAIVYAAGYNTFPNSPAPVLHDWVLLLQHKTK